MRQLMLLVVLFSSLVFSHAAKASVDNVFLTAYQTPDVSDCLSGKLALHLAISPDGKQALSEPADLNEVWLWDVQSGKKLWSYQNNEDIYSNITTLAFSPNGKYFLMANLDKAIVWDRVTYEQVGVFPRLQRAYDTDADFMMDSDYLLVSGAGEGVQLWEIESQKLIHSFPGLTKAYLSPNEQYILVSQDEISWDLWNIWDGIKLHTFSGGTVPHFTPDSKWVATENSIDGLILTSIQNPEITQSVLPPRQWSHGLQFSPDGKYILTGDDNGRDILVEVTTGKIAYTFPDLPDPKLFIKNFGNDTLIGYKPASFSDITEIRIWSLNDFSLITEASINTGDIFNTAYTDDRKYLLTANDKSKYILWDLDTFETISHFC